MFPMQQTVNQRAEEPAATVKILEPLILNINQRWDPIRAGCLLCLWVLWQWGKSWLLSPTEEDLNSWEASKPMRESSPVTPSCCWVEQWIWHRRQDAKTSGLSRCSLGRALNSRHMGRFMGKATSQKVPLTLKARILGFFCHEIYHSLTIFRINYWVQFSVSFKDLNFSLEIRFSSGILSSLWHQWLLG